MTDEKFYPKLINLSKKIMQASYKGVVHPWELDVFGHCNVRNYVGKFDEASWQFMGDLGFSRAYCERNHRALFAVECHIKYIQELRAGERFYIQSSITEIKEKAIKFEHKMYKTESNDLTATYEVVAVHVDTNKRKSIDIPSGIYQKLLKFLDY